MIGCLVLAFQLCNPNYGYAQGYAYAQSGYYAPQYYYAQPAPVIVAPPPVYYAQPYYGYGRPFGMGGIGVAVGRHGGVAVNVR